MGTPFYLIRPAVAGACIWSSVWKRKTGGVVIEMVFDGEKGLFMPRFLSFRKEDVIYSIHRISSSKSFSSFSPAGMGIASCKASRNRIDCEARRDMGVFFSPFFILPFFSDEMI